MQDSKQILDEIRSRISIVNLVAEHVALKRSGRNHKGLCPFHQEKTPSFMVTDEKQIFHCFGCGAGGDIFTFLMKVNGLTFPEALRELAKRSGVKLPERSASSREASKEWTQKKEWALQLNRIAHEHFISNLSKAQAYLKRRGLSPETAKTYGLGFADEHWDALAQKFIRSKAPLKLAEEIGLIRKRPSEEGYYDFFRNRLIFPIQDAQGNVIAFGGRSPEDKQEPKYLNSADSFLYHKSKAVYGLNFAKEAIRQNDEAFLVEGYLDALTLWQAGMANAVAPLGTALSADHLRLLGRFTQNFLVAFDGDSAGRKAAFRSLPLFLELGFTPKKILLGEKEDPDSFLRERGIEAWKTLKQKSPTLFEALIDDQTAGMGNDTQAKIRAWETLRPLLAEVRNPVEAGLYRKRIAQRLGVEEAWLTRSKKQETRGENPPSETQFPKEEQLLIAAMLLEPTVIPTVQQAHLDFTDPALKEFCTQLFGKYAEEGCVSLAAFQNDLPGDLGRWIRELALLEGEAAGWKQVVTDCLNKKAAKKLEAQIRMLNEKIVRAENEGNEAELLKQLAQKRKLLEAKHHERS